MKGLSRSAMVGYSRAEIGAKVYSFMLLRTVPALLTIPLGAVVRLAEHLAVVNIGSAALAPGGHMVGVHVLKVPDSGVIGIMTDSAEGAVGLSLLLRCCRLLRIDGFLRGLIEDADVQQFRVLTTVQDVLVDALLFLHIVALV